MATKPDCPVGNRRQFLIAPASARSRLISAWFTVYRPSPASVNSPPAKSALHADRKREIVAASVMPSPSVISSARKAAL